MIQWQCAGCGRVGEVPENQTITCNCGHVTRHQPERPTLPDGSHIPPSILKKGINYANAWFRWAWKGMPKRSKEEVLRIRSICEEPCEYFDGQVCTHSKCGCSVKSPGAFGDKILWATESCPIDKW